MELTYKNKKTNEEIDIKIKNILDNQKSILDDEKNIFIFDDNFIAMCCLLKNYENKIDLVYIDPPYNTNGKFYYSKENTSTISHSKNDILAYDDDMDLDDYLEFIRERLYLIKKLMSKTGTLYLHIDIKVGHYIKILLDEIFGKECFMNEITRIKSNPKNFKRKAFGNEKDIIYIYSKEKNKNIFNDIKIDLSEDELDSKFKKIDHDGRRYTTVPCHAPGETQSGATGELWRNMAPPKGRHWRCSPKELEHLNQMGLIEWSKTNNPRIKKYADEHKGKKIQDVWSSYKDPQKPKYPTEKNNEMLNMIIRQSSNKDSIIMDCFAGSSSFLSEGLKLNRKVIGIDKSLVSLELLKKRNIDNLITLIKNKEIGID